ncbi:MAG: cytochrome P450, partial [Armatimonadetes bacterium]|nr:cytochrome P450 [Anaerolineae bacterium]
MTAITVAPSHPLFGNLRAFTRDTLQFMLEARQYGDIAQFKFGPFPFYVLNHPDLVHQVLVTDAQRYHKSRVIKSVLYPTLGKGLLTNEGDSWKRQRKLAQPAFHTKRIANYADVMVAYADALTQTWVDGAAVDVENDMNILTMQIVVKTLFDLGMNRDSETLSDAVKTVLHTSDIRLNRLAQIPGWLPTPENRKMTQALALLNLTIQGFIDERRRTGEDRGDLLSMLIAAQDDDNGTGMDDKQLRDEAMTIFGA